MRILKSNLEKVEKDHKTKTALLESTERKYNVISNKNDELKSSFVDLENNIEISENKTFELNKQLNELKIKTEECKIEKARLHNAKDFMDDFLKERSDTLENLKIKETETKNKLNKTFNEQKQIELEIEKIEDKTESLEIKNKLITSEIDTLTISLKSLKVKDYFINNNTTAKSSVDNVLRCIESKNQENEILVKNLQTLDTLLNNLTSSFNLEDEEANKAKEDLESLVAELGVL